MTTVSEIINEIKTNEKRREFFENKAKESLKKNGITYDDETFNKLFMEAVDTFNGSTPQQIIFHIHNYIKTNIPKPERKYPKNDYFRESEMIILEKYLEQKEDGYYRTTEEIASELEIEIYDVIITKRKFKEAIHYKFKEMHNIFGNVISSIDKIEDNTSRQKGPKRKKTSITDEDIEIIGKFTGQINDICLDIDELAKEKQISIENIKDQIRQIYALLSDENNYKKLISKYPKINNMLKLKGKGLGITLPITIIFNDDVDQCVHFFKQIYKKDENGEYTDIHTVAKKLGYANYNSFSHKKRTFEKRLEQDKKFRKKVLTAYPTMDRDKNEYEKSTNKTQQTTRKKTKSNSMVKERKAKHPKSTNSNSDKISKDVEVLKYFFKKQENGEYLSNWQIADKLKIKKESIYQRKINLLKKLENNFEYKQKVLNEYPELYEDIEKRKKKKVKSSNEKKAPSSRKTLTPEEKAAKDIEALKYFFKKQEDGKYLSNWQIADKLKIKKESIYQIKINLLKKLENSFEYKQRVLKEYPELYEDIEKRKNATPDEINKNIELVELSNEDIDKYITILQYFFKKQENGEYLQKSEIAAKMKTTNSNASRTKNNIMRIIENQPEYKQKILEIYPELDEDIKIYESIHKTQNGKRILNPKNISKDVIALKYFFKAREDKTYLPISEVANLLGLTYTGTYIKRKVLLDRINEKKEYKDLIVIEYPELDDDIKKWKEKKDNDEQKVKSSNRKNSTSSRKALTPEEKTAKDVEVLKYFFKKQEDGKYLSNCQIADKLKIKKESIYQRKVNLLKKLESSFEYKQRVLNEYPELYEDIEKRKDATPDEINKNIELVELSNEDIDKCITILQYFFKKQENGEYLQKSEIAAKMKTTNSNASRTKNNIMRIIENQPEYKQKILEIYSTLYEDIEAKENDYNNSTKYNNEQIKEDIKILKLIFKKKEDGTYHSTTEIANLLEITDIGVHKKKNRVLRKLDENSEYREKILKEYPELNEDLESNAENYLNEKEKAVADLLYTDKTRVLEKLVSYSKNLEISAQGLAILRNQTITKISNNPALQKQYPNSEVEYEIMRNHRKKRSIQISQEELDNIRKNARRYDIPHTKASTRDNLIKGINSFEGVYNDFASLCTYEQKAMLALRLGFFNITEFSTEDVANMFKVDKEEVEILTRECLKSNNNNNKRKRKSAK